MLPVARATAISGATPPSDDEVGHRPQDPERDDAGPGRGVVAEDHPVQRAGLARRGRSRGAPRAGCRSGRSRSPSRTRRAPRCRASGSAVVPPLTWPTMSRPRLEDDVRADRARAGDRRAAGVERGDEAVRAGPGEHRRGVGAGLHGAQADLADEVDAGVGELREVCSSRPCSRIGAPARTFTPAGRTFANARCATIASALSPTMSFGRPGQVDLARGDHRRDAAVEPRLDEVDACAGAASSRRTRGGRGSR